MSLEVLLEVSDLAFDVPYSPVSDSPFDLGPRGAGSQLGLVLGEPRFVGDG